MATLRRFVESFEQRWSPECGSRSAEDGEWGVLKIDCVNGGTFVADENKALPPTRARRPELEVKSGDVLMSRASGSPKPVGSVAHVFNPPARLMLSDKISSIKLLEDVAHGPFALLMDAAPLRRQIEQAIGGAEGLANNLPHPSIKGFWSYIPPMQEEQEITKFSALETSELNALGAEAERDVTILKERRSALTAAVTGQIDVCRA